MSLQIIIHRATHQIGGCVTEISTENSRIIIDFGTNLQDSDTSNCKSDADILQEVFGSKSCDAVLFTHYHGDHIGMYKNIPQGIPLYIGSTAKKILRVIAEKIDYQADIKGLPIINNMKTYQIGQWLQFGEIKVKPFIVDHSALDSYMFLIEAGGKRMLYTGDFRDHGIAKGNLSKVQQEYVKEDIDILITEGTMLSRTDEIKYNQVMTEEDLGKKANEIFSKEENKYNFVLVSSTNLDSIMEFYHATPANKAFVCDSYQAQLMQIAMKDKGKYYKKYKPAYLGNRIRPIYVIGNLDGLSKDDGFGNAQFHIMKEKGFVMLVRANKNPNEKGKFEKAMEYFADSNPLIIYSMWEGYLREKHIDMSLVNFIGEYRTEHLHTSGHAYVETIKKVIDMVNPKVIIPMHTECAEEFASIDNFQEYSNRIVVLQDGEIFKGEV